MSQFGAPLGSSGGRRTHAGCRSSRILTHADVARRCTGLRLGSRHKIVAPTDGDAFLAYLKPVLCPQLRPNQYVALEIRRYTT